MRLKRCLLSIGLLGATLSQTVIASGFIENTTIPSVDYEWLYHVGKSGSLGSHVAASIHMSASYCSLIDGHSHEYKCERLGVWEKSAKLYPGIFEFASIEDGLTVKRAFEIRDRLIELTPVATEAQEQYESFYKKRQTVKINLKNIRDKKIPASKKSIEAAEDQLQVALERLSGEVLAITESHNEHMTKLEREKNRLLEEIAETDPENIERIEKLQKKLEAIESKIDDAKTAYAEAINENARQVNASKEKFGLLIAKHTKRLDQLLEQKEKLEGELELLETQVVEAYSRFNDITEEQNKLLNPNSTPEHISNINTFSRQVLQNKEKNFFYDAESEYGKWIGKSLEKRGKSKHYTFASYRDPRDFETVNLYSSTGDYVPYDSNIKWESPNKIARVDFSLVDYFPRTERNCLKPLEVMKTRPLLFGIEKIIYHKQSDLGDFSGWVQISDSAEFFNLKGIRHWHTREFSRAERITDHHCEYAVHILAL